MQVIAMHMVSSASFWRLQICLWLLTLVLILMQEQKCTWKLSNNAFVENFQYHKKKKERKTKLPNRPTSFWIIEMNWQNWIWDFNFYKGIMTGELKLYFIYDLVMQLWEVFWPHLSGTIVNCLKPNTCTSDICLCCQVTLPPLYLIATLLPGWQCCQRHSSVQQHQLVK